MGLAGTRAPLLTGWNGFGISQPIAGTRAPILSPGDMTRRPAASPTSGSKPPGVSAEEWARSEAQRYIDELIANINDQKSAYMADVQKNSELQAQRGQALMQALQALNVPGVVQGVYTNAANNMAGLAGGFAGDIRDIASADAAQNQRMVSGTGQEGAVRNEGSGMGDVAYGVGGYIPGLSMGEQGAAFASEAALEPGFAARIGQVNAANAFDEGMKGMDEFSKAIADAQGQRFDMEQNLLKGRQDTLLDQQKLADAKTKQLLAMEKARYTQYKDARDFHLKQAYLALAVGNTKRYNAQLKLSQQAGARADASAQRAANSSAGLDASGAPKPGYHMEGGQVVKDGWKIGKAGVPVKIPTPKAPGSNKPSTSSKVPGTPAYNASALQAVGKARASMDTDIRKTIFRDPDPLKGDDLTGGPVPTMTYQQAASQLWTKYQYLATTPAAKKALRAQIASALAAAGLKPKKTSKPIKRPSTVRGGD